MSQDYLRVRKVSQDEFTALQRNFLDALNRAIQAKSNGANAAIHYEEAHGIISHVEKYIGEGALNADCSDVLTAMKSKYSSLYRTIKMVAYHGPKECDLIRRLSE